MIAERSHSYAIRFSSVDLPFRYAAAQNNFHVVTYLLRQEHDTEALLRDRKFVFNLMVVGKAHKFKPIEDFVFVSPAPCFTASKLSSFYRQMALKEKDRAADLMEIGDVCEELAKDLTGIGSNSGQRPFSHFAKRKSFRECFAISFENPFLIP